MQEHHENLCSVKGDWFPVGDSFSRDSHLGGWVSSTISTIVSPNKEIHIITYIYIYMSYTSTSVCLWLSQIVCFKFRWQITSHMKHANMGGGSLLFDACISHDCIHLRLQFSTPELQDIEQNTPWWLDKFIQLFFSVYCFEEKSHTTLSSKDIQLKSPCFVSSTIISLVLLKSPIDKTPNISFNAEFQFGFFVHGFLLCESPKIHILSKHEISQFLNLLLSHVKRWSISMWTGKCRVCLLFSVCHFFKKNIKWINVYLVLAHMKIYESNEMIPLDKGESTKYPKSLPCHPSISL